MRAGVTLAQGVALCATVEIFHKSQRVASHLRAHGHGHAITIAEHRPRSHQAHLEWTPRLALLLFRQFVEHVAELVIAATLYVLTCTEHLADQ